MINTTSFQVFPCLRFTRRSLLFWTAIFSMNLVFAQDLKAPLDEYLKIRLDDYQLDPSDVTNLEITSQHTSSQSGVTYVYARQTYAGIPVANGVANFAIKGGKVVHMGSRLIPQLNGKIKRQSPSMTPIEAVQATAVQLQLNSPRDLTVVKEVSSLQYVCSPGGISRDEIPVQLMYHAVSPGDIRLVWDMLIYTPDGDHWWSVRIDASSGEIVDQKDMILHCNFDQSPFMHHTHHSATCASNGHAPLVGGNPDQYNVLPLPAESPNHGVHAIVSNPADLVASPFGWHDADGVAGAEYTITRGNNVYAYEDADDDDEPGFSPDGTAALDFNFPYLPGDIPANYQAAAITNLFYMNNMMHDIWYQYGFDEESGNFQQFNYLGSDGGDDYVLAEAQDGGGLNNANFGTPPDGSNPRMQMYLWNNTVPSNFLVINSPADIAGEYLASAGSFGPELPDIPVTGDIVLLIDDTDPVNDGCNPIVNGLDLAGKIALIDRGDCAFVDKVEAAQGAGAIAVIIVNNVPGDPTQMGGFSGSIFIPSIMISQADGDTIKSRLLLGNVNGAVSDGDGAVNKVLDGDFDNGIIAHEYGHGISNRLVGGKGDVGCLFNAEQMGEGWSDWFGLMLTMEPGDLGTDIRGIGTFATDQTTTGTGIRPAPYSTDFNINGYTYGASNDVGSISEPHGVGFIFATMLWDLNWALIDAYGGIPDPDLFTGSGGNNIAMRLIIEGLKLTNCGPGMEDGRDGILMADQVLYDGAHQCLIWEVFARRGLGFSADQGSTDSRTDQVEAFDIPTTCQTAIELPVAAFTVDTLFECTRTVMFTDSSYSIPQAWHWEFGDGNSSEERNPTHTYLLGGTYMVKLLVTNTIGKDSTFKEIRIEVPPTPLTEDIHVCSGDTALIPTSVTGRAFWKDTTNTLVFVGDTLVLTDVQSVQTFYVENYVGEPSQFVGPVDGSISGGGYHGSGYFGATNFTAERDFTIVSAWVDANNAGERTFILAQGTNLDGDVPGSGSIIQQVTVNIPAGQSRVMLDLKVPSAGEYTLGASLNFNSSLFRNNGGADFPFELPGFMTMTGSSAGIDPFLYYYYLYNWEVREGDLCISDPDTVTVTPLISQFDFVDDGSATLFFTDLSTGATSWHWDFGDGNTSAEQNPVHTYNDEGDYTITLTINDGLCSVTQTYTVLISGTGHPLNALSLLLQPNPTHDETTLRLNETVTEDLDVMVRDVSGKTFHHFTWKAGKRDQIIDVTSWPAGIYILDVKGHSYSAVRKLVVE